MSYSEGCPSPGGELFEYEDLTGGGEGPSTSQRVHATERLTSSRFPSEMSMDLSELQTEEGSSSRLAHSNHSSSDNENMIPISPRRQHRQRISDLTEDSMRKKDSEEEDSGFFSYRSGSRGAHSMLKFDELPEDIFQSSDMSDFTSFYTDSQTNHRHSLQTVDEQGDTESENSISASSLANPQSRRGSLNSSMGSLNISRRKVKFEISTRLEDIQEYAKPDVEDYHMLYYTSHELQKMIDAKKEEERKERTATRLENREQSEDQSEELLSTELSAIDLSAAYQSETDTS
eukprot:CAMPEP_0116142132 /NCGR_PEP_ID=MMETSP0329-20121206/14744_1 /TAXON_ID=697910 /ORGANISM="Pseudo-nitzschia arenysensis, Strain B593" /LENGTH=288 /DNA_ID=CAMNT_0003637345 /DNA_START=255 /DNA_END=1121 /DNA_ORIENTATION=+